MWYRLKSIFLLLYLTWGVVLCGFVYCDHRSIDRVYMCVCVCVLSRSLFTIYRDVIYNEIDRFNFPTVP